MQHRELNRLGHSMIVEVRSVCRLYALYISTLLACAVVIIEIKNADTGKPNSGPNVLNVGGAELSRLCSRRMTPAKEQLVKSESDVSSCSSQQT